MTDHEFKSQWVDMRMKHLEFIQGVIGRMGNNSANLKNYCMTLSAGALGLSAAVQRSDVLIFCLPMVLIFSVLDASYLRLERAFRDQYESIRMQKIDCQPDFIIAPAWSSVNSRFQAFFSWSVFGFYFPISLILFLISFII